MLHLVEGVVVHLLKLDVVLGELLPQDGHLVVHNPGELLLHEVLEEHLPLGELLVVDLVPGELLLASKQDQLLH